MADGDIMPGAGTNNSTPAFIVALRPGCLKEAPGPASELTFPPETWAAEGCGPDLGIWMPPAPRLGLDMRRPSASESTGLALVQQGFEGRWLPPPATLSTASPLFSPDTSAACFSSGRLKTIEGSQVNVTASACAHNVTPLCEDRVQRRMIPAPRQFRHCPPSLTVRKIKPGIILQAPVTGSDFHNVTFFLIFKVMLYLFRKQRRKTKLKG